LVLRNTPLTRAGVQYHITMLGVESVGSSHSIVWLPAPRYSPGPNVADKCSFGFMFVMPRHTAPSFGCGVGYTITWPFRTVWAPLNERHTVAMFFKTLTFASVLPPALAVPILPTAYTVTGTLAASSGSVVETFAVM